MTRRGMLRGDWFKVIRDRGAALIRTEEEAGPQFRIEAPAGRTQRGSIHIHRPPHAVPESEFLASCTKCDACIEVCPPHAIFRAPDNSSPVSIAGTPIIDAHSQPCVMCSDVPCVPVCEAGVLTFDAPIAMGLAKIDTIACIAYRGTICTVCVERCPVENAITMEAGRPKVDSDVCTGCGECVYVCPAPVPGGAIMLVPPVLSSH